MQLPSMRKISNIFQEHLQIYFSQIPITPHTTSDRCSTAGPTNHPKQPHTSPCYFEINSFFSRINTYQEIDNFLIAKALNSFCDFVLHFKFHLKKHSHKARHHAYFYLNKQPAETRG
ncbi:hypothetical protein BDI4_120133 [Burkholderia diffusa]|nr:hypothetical protein BDI4_120133 [Burkholderia diffusa]